MNNKYFKLTNLIVLIFFLIFFFSIQNIFLPIQKYYLYIKLSYLNIFLEILKFILINMILLKIENKRLKILFIFISIFFYYSGSNFFMIYLSWVFQNEMKENRKKHIIYLISLIILYYYCCFNIEYFISINKEYLIHLFLLIELLILLFSVVYLSTKEDILKILKEIITNEIFNIFLIAIIVNASINFIPVFIDFNNYKWLYVNNMVISSLLTIFIMSIFIFLNISIFDKKIKLYPFIFISFFLNTIMNQKIYLFNKTISKEIIFIAYIFIILYGINLIANFRRNRIIIKYNYICKLIFILIYLLNNFIYIGIHKYDNENFQNIFLSTTLIRLLIISY